MDEVVAVFHPENRSFTEGRPLPGSAAVEEAERFGRTSPWQVAPPTS